MIEENEVATNEKPPPNPIWTWLFNPFHYIAGGTALAIGLAVILAVGWIGPFSNSHFDGVLDFHMGAPGTWWSFLAEGIINWLSLACVLFAAGTMMSKSKVRFVDVFGTQALARFPTIITVTGASLPGVSRYNSYLVNEYLQELAKNPTTIPQINSDLFVFGGSIALSLVMIIWMVALMYRAFTVSCNVRGGKAIGTFIVALIIAEIISKIAWFAALWPAIKPLMG